MLGGTSSALAQSASLERISRASPFAANCGGPAAGGTLFTNAEVEPWVSANPEADRNLVAVWQQDRWSNGGAQGNLTGVSFDRGGSWQRPTPPPFSRCAGGNAANGGDYDRASDPWVSFGGDGSAHQIALAVSADQTDQRHPRLELARRRPHLGPDHHAPARHQRGAVQRQGVDHGRSAGRPLRLRGLGSPPGPEPGQPGLAVLGRHVVRPLDRRRPHLGADADDPRLPGQQQHPDARQPDRRAERRDAGQHLRPDRPRAAARGSAALDRSRRDVVGPDRRRRAVQQRHAGSGRRRSVRPAPGADRRPAARGRRRPAPALGRRPHRVAGHPLHAGRPAADTSTTRS